MLIDQFPHYSRTVPKIILLSFMLNTFIGYSQQVIIDKPDFVKKSVRFGGSLSIGGNYYQASNIAARRPAQVGRLNYNGLLEVGRYFQLSTKASVSTVPLRADKV